MNGAARPAPADLPPAPGTDATATAAVPATDRAASSGETAAPVRLSERAAVDFIAYRAGEREALDRLVRALTPMLWHIARSYRLDSATAEDVVQATWFTLVRKADQVAEPRALVSWLAVTTRREAWRVLRTADRTQVLDDTVDVRTPDELGPEQEAEQTQRNAALWQAVSRLEERCGRLLRIVAFSERPDYEAVSRELAMPVGSIGPTRGRCLEKLGRLLRESGWSQA